MSKKNRLAEDEPNQLGLFLSEEYYTDREALRQVRRVARPKSVTWLDPRILCDHPLNEKLFGPQRVLEVDDLVLSLNSGYDIGRSIKAVKREDGRIVIIDGHRRKRAAIIVNCNVPVIIQPLENERAELEEMVLSNLLRNRSHKLCGIGTAVRVIQMIKPRDIKRGRPSKKIKAQRARFIGDNKESLNPARNQYQRRASGQAVDDMKDSRRAYYAKLLGISEKRFRAVDYVLRHGTEEEKRELDFGPRKLTALFKAVQARMTGEKEIPAEDPRVVARSARAALRTAKSFFALIGNKKCLEEIDADISSLVHVARSELAGKKPEGSTAIYALELYRKQIMRELEGAVIAKD